MPGFLHANPFKSTAYCKANRPLSVRHASYTYLRHILYTTTIEAALNYKFYTFYQTLINTSTKNILLIFLYLGCLIERRKNLGGDYGQLPWQRRKKELKALPRRLILPFYFQICEKLNCINREMNVYDYE